MTRRLSSHLPSVTANAGEEVGTAASDNGHVEQPPAEVRAQVAGATAVRDRRRSGDARKRSRTVAKQQQAAERIATATNELTANLGEASDAAAQLETAMQEIAAGSAWSARR